MSTNEFPIGDVKRASEAMAAIDQLLHQRGLDPRRAMFTIDGSPSRMSHEKAARWIREAEEEGYSEIRFILEMAASKSVEVNLSASTPRTTATDFRPPENA